MTSVFVTGASGYIGSQVAIAFRNAGYRVYGLVRSAEKGQHLVRHEVIPVVGDLNDIKTYHEALDKSAIVIDTVAEYTREGDPLAGNKLILDATAASASKSGVKKTYIYTSGVLVYGHSEHVRDETEPLDGGDFPFFKARIAFENLTLHHTGVRGIVIRPGFVYGGHTGAGNHLAGYFQPKETLVINEELRTKRWNWIHVVDLADAYVRAAKHSHAVAGEAFNIVSTSSPTYEQLTVSAAKVAGFTGKVEYTHERKDFVSQLANKTVLLTNDKARDLLGWIPNHKGVLEELDIYYHTIKGTY